MEFSDWRKICYERVMTTNLVGMRIFGRNNKRDIIIIKIKLIDSEEYDLI